MNLLPSDIIHYYDGGEDKDDNLRCTILGSSAAYASDRSC